jgi:hypothetical protein
MPGRSRPLLLLVTVPLVLWTLGACNCGGQPEPEGEVDAGAEATADAGAVDAPVADAGTGAGSDAGSMDAGAGSMDAGAVEDAGAPDAGGLDAGAPDAAVAYDDAGCSVPPTVVLDATDAGLPVDGLRLWLRADTAVSVTADGEVCRWNDVSGLGHDFTPATATRPRWVATGLNGYPAVSFPGPNRHLTRAGVLGIPPTAGRTAALIGLDPDLTHRFLYFEMGQVGTPGTYFSLDTNTFNTTGGKEGAYLTNNAYDADLATAAEVRTHVLSVSTLDAGTPLPGPMRYSVNGTVRTLTRTSGGLGNGTIEDFSGANTTLLGYGVSGFTGAVVGDVLVYDRALTASERTEVEAYLRGRYPSP